MAAISTLAQLTLIDATQFEIHATYHLRLYQVDLNIERMSNCTEDTVCVPLKFKMYRPLSYTYITYASVFPANHIKLQLLRKGGNCIKAKRKVPT